MSSAHIASTSKNTSIYDSSFTDVHGNLNIYYGDSYHHNGQTGLIMLSRTASIGAAHDSQERYPPPRCHPGTRKELLKDIESWIDSGPKMGRRICWVHGPAGAGKTAIAQTISEAAAERGQLTASFFFSRSAPGRNTITQLITTIALQIAISCPHTRPKIQQAIEADPSLLHKATSVQLRHLIVGPLHSTTSRTPGSIVKPFLLIIDGLDECKGNSDQCLILSHILELVDTHHLHLQFLVVSRPEPHIRHAFNNPVMKKFTKEISIYGDHQAREDVLTFLKSGFERIHGSERHGDTMSFIPKPWPSEDVLQLLVERSGGYFIYASTVLKYIDEEYFSCTDRLREVLASSSSNSGSTAFAELDRLYIQILSTCPDANLLLRILAYYLVPLDPIKGPHSHRLTPSEIEAVLNLQPGRVMLTLRGLHSIFSGISSPYSADIKPIHASFTDFIFDGSRAGIYFIDPHKCREDIIRCSLILVEALESRKESYASRDIWNSVNKIWNHYLTDISDELVQHIHKSTKREVWISFFQGSRSCTIKEQVRIIFVLTRVINELQFRTKSCVPHELIRRFVELRDLAFRTHLFHKSSTEVQLIQDVFTYIHSCQKPPKILASLLLLSDSQARMCIFDACFDYMNRIMRSSALLDYGYYEPSTGQALVDFMFDSRRCGSLYCDSTIRSAHIAYYCLRFLTFPVHGASDISEAYVFARTKWAQYISFSSPDYEELLSLLRICDVPPYAGEDILTSTCLENLDLQRKFDIVGNRFVEDEFYSEPFPSNSDIRMMIYKDDLSNAEMVVTWLKKMRKPPQDILNRWEVYLKGAVDRLEGVKEVDTPVIFGVG